MTDTPSNTPNNKELEVTWEFRIIVHSFGKLDKTHDSIAKELCRAVHHRFGKNATVLDHDGIKLEYDPIVDDGNEPDKSRGFTPNPAVDYSKTVGAPEYAYREK